MYLLHGSSLTHEAVQTLRLLNKADVALLHLAALHSALQKALIRDEAHAGALVVAAVS